MKKILLIALAIVFWQAQGVYAIDEFLTGEPAGTQNLSSIDDYVEDNNIALVRGLADLRTGCELVYASASTLTVNAGSVGCVNSDKTILRTRINTSALTLTWSNIDTGSEETSQTYYVFALGDADTSTFVCKITESSTAPSGATYYKRLGSFYNNSSGNIERIDNQDLGMWEQDSDEVQLKQADNIDMRDMYIKNLSDPSDDQDASTKAYTDAVVAGTGLWEVDGTEHQLVTADEIDMQTKRIINQVDPISDQDGATKKYVDDNKNVDAAVTRAKLATTTGEVSTSGTSQEILTLPGGEYGFWPNSKVSVSSTAYRGGINFWGSFTFNQTSYGAYICAEASSGTLYFQQRYITASGIDHWLFLLVDKSTKKLLSAWSADDHPSYGQEADHIELPHPFNSYDSSKHYVVLAGKSNAEQLRQEATEKEVSLLTLINDDYKVNWQSAPDYVPLHSGKFLGEAPILINEIPDYIKMKNLIKLAEAEKVARDEQREADEEAREQIRQEKESKRQSGKDKLKIGEPLTDDELNALFE